MTVSYEEILELARRAVKENLRYSGDLLGYELPEETLHGLCIAGFTGELYKLEELVNLLVNESTFPHLVDLAVLGLSEGKTCILWIPSGDPETSVIDESWNQGLGPFKPAGVMSPKSHYRLTPEELEKLASDWRNETGPTARSEAQDAPS